MKQTTFTDYQSTPHRQGRGCNKRGRRHKYRYVCIEGPFFISGNVKGYERQKYQCTECGYPKWRRVYL